MRFNRFFHLPAAIFVAFMLLAVFTPRELRAATVVYSVDLSVPTGTTNFHSIQDAIDAAETALLSNP